MMDYVIRLTACQSGLGCDARYVSRCKKRFETDRLSGLFGRYQGRARTVLTPKLEAKILSWTAKKPSDGSTHWTTRKLARQLGINHMLVARAWKRANLKPHRIKRYMASNDPNFEAKAADVIGLYVNPPQHAAVFCVDEKTAIQALDRLDPVLPLSPGRVERHGFEYYRHGTLSENRVAPHFGRVRGVSYPDRGPPTPRAGDPHHRRQSFGSRITAGGTPALPVGAL